MIIDDHNEDNRIVYCVLVVLGSFLSKEACYSLVNRDLQIDYDYEIEYECEFWISNQWRF